MASLGSLPSELKRMVLQAVPDFQTLRSLVLASPDYHAVYLLNRATILPSMALQELRGRHINILAPFHWAQMHLHGPNKETHHHLVKPAIQNCIQQHQKGQPLTLTIDESIALLSIVYFDPHLMMNTWERPYWYAQRLKYDELDPVGALTKGRDRLVTRVSGWPLPTSLPEAQFEAWYEEAYVSFEEEEEHDRMLQTVDYKLLWSEFAARVGIEAYGW